MITTYLNGHPLLRMLLPKDPQLAISIIELTLTGEMSSDNLTIQLATENLQIIKKNMIKQKKLKDKIKYKNTNLI